MKSILSKNLTIFLFIFSFIFLQVMADNYPQEKISDQNSELIIESNNQESDLKNSIFYAEGNVVITNSDKGFIAKSKKAIFYKLKREIKLIGDVEVITSDSNIIKAGEILYNLEKNKFEAISDSKQRVNTLFNFNENNILIDSQDK